MAAGSEKAVRAGRSSSGEISAEIAAKALVLGLLRRADHRGTDVRIDLQLALPTRLMASDPNLPAKVALESRCEFSVEKQVHTSMNVSFGPCSHCSEV